MEKGILLYLNIKNVESTFKTEIKSQILCIKGQMNDSRTSFIFPSLHKVEITPFWFLGFIEWEGWFLKTKIKTIRIDILVLDKQ